MTQPQTTVISATSARLGFSEVIERARYGGERFIVEQDGEPHVVIIGVQEYESLLQQLEGLEDAQDMAASEKGEMTSLHEYTHAGEGNAVYQVFLHRDAAHELDDVPFHEHQRILDQILSLEQDPRPAGCIQIVDDVHRLQVGPWRVIYAIDDAQRRVSIGKIARRR